MSDRGEEQIYSVARSSRVNNNGMVKKRSSARATVTGQLARLARSAMRKTRLVAFLQAR